MSEALGARYSVIGPPGTGKTTYLKRQVERAAARFGASNVVAVSLTRAAAAELGGRVEGLPKTAVGTLHAMCYRLLGHPTIAESKVDEWNARNPSLAISVSADTKNLEHDGDIANGAGPGQDLYEGMQLFRHRRASLAGTRYETFWNLWSAWCEESGYVDFTGLIERALAECPTAPGAPLAVFGDETQDMSRLEMDLLLQWGRAATGAFVAVGDDAQALYTWRGADPRAFLDAGERIVLRQSHRVPSKVHAVATRWGRELLEGVSYQPREDAGEVEHAVEPLEAGVKVVERELARTTGTVMLQAQCSYMLTPLLKTLKQRGHVFANPNRLSNGQWNPLGVAKSTAAVRTVDRVVAFLECADPELFTPERVRLFAPMLEAKLMRRGWKQRADQISTESEATEMWADDDVLMQVWSGDLDWLAAHVTGQYRERVAYLARAAQHHDLREAPRLLVGTIHSFKGAEADTVIVAPNVSPQAWEQWRGPGGDRSALRRLFYVGMTRARHRLVLLAPSKRGRCVSWSE